MERIRKGSDLPEKKWGSPSIQQKYSRVRTGHVKPGKSWNLIIHFPGLESRGIKDRVMESHGKSVRFL